MIGWDRFAQDFTIDARQAAVESDVPGKINSFDEAPNDGSALVGRMADPLMLRRDIRIWLGWGKALVTVG